MPYRLAAFCAALLALAALQPAARASWSAQRPLRVAMLSDGGTFQDNSFNQNSREGIEALMFAGSPLFVQFVETASPANFRRKLAAFAERDYRLLVGVGYRMAEAIEAVAAEYPRTWFVGVDGHYDRLPHNVWALAFQVDECAFPAGHLAAAWADLQDPEDPAVAWVGGMDVDSVNQFVVGFRGGVEHYNRLRGRAVRVLGAHVGSFEDFEGGRRMANGFIADGGADVVFGVGSISGTGAIAAAAAAGKWAIGVDTDQYHTLIEAQSVLLTSCLKRMDMAVRDAVEAALRNEFMGGTRRVGTLANGGVDLAPFHEYEDRVPARVKEELADIQRQIVAGTLSTGWTKEP